MRLCPKTQHRRAESALTLVEVAISMAVLGVILISLFATFTFGFNTVKISRDELRATQLLHEQMEKLRLYSWDQIAEQTNFVKADFSAPLGLTGPVFFSGKIIITNAQSSVSNGFAPMTEAYAKNLRTIIVTLTWTNNNLKRVREARTYISHYGMQNYVP